MEMELSKLTTEKRNPVSVNMDQISTLKILQVINSEDKKVAEAVETVLPEVAVVVEKVYEALRNGGRLFYVGAGTSGRIGIIDASECPPTFMTDPEMIQTVMAGGNGAFFQAVEGAEDNEQQGGKDLQSRGLTDKDVVVGITASGRTPYPIGALKYAQTVGAYTVSLTCNKNSVISRYANTGIEVVVGPEVLTGSTRMKSATAHKMVLNMISTGTMVKLGKVYENLMVDLHASNYKLKERAKSIIMEITDASYEKAGAVLDKTNNEVKPAIVMIEAEVDYEKAKDALDKCKGYVRKAIEYLV
ncbi:N-acetylmuramic acid 6-phosphate etherase [Oceanobacillus salinisoli]|uniref:N-acetylmuramic acid 6-phosphate etherase n=1 Tax=Oceanobacillus salinisoli TaxID=2678611 RepID=UPI0022AFB261|nr:N-acetylmuramic acid 6-phosphate etherase [Oceanobacillus salinisoli]